MLITNRIFRSLFWKLAVFTSLFVNCIFAYAQADYKAPSVSSLSQGTYKSSRAGMVVFEYGVTRQVLSGMLRGSDAVDPLLVLQNPEYKKLPYLGSHDCRTVTDPCLLTNVGKRMVKDVHNFIISYHQTNKISWAAKFKYLSNTIDMYEKMSATIPVTEFQMGSSGIGDVQLSMTNRLAKTYLFDINLTLGIKLPLGSINVSDGIVDMTGNTGYAPYDMQLGSGTYDIITELEVDGSYYGLEYGSSIYRVTRTGFNNQNYNLGDELKLRGWLRYTASFGTQIRFGLTQNVWSLIEGRDMRMSDNTLYTGGKRLDGLLGLGQNYDNFSIYVDYAYPILQYLNGVQMKTTGVYMAGMKIKFM